MHFSHQFALKERKHIASDQNGTIRLCTPFKRIQRTHRWPIKQKQRAHILHLNKYSAELFNCGNGVFKLFSQLHNVFVEFM